MSDFFERVAARTLATIPIVRRRREPIFAVAASAGRQTFETDVFDDAFPPVSEQRRPESVVREPAAEASALAASIAPSSRAMYAGVSEERSQHAATQTVAMETHPHSSGDRGPSVGPNERSGAPATVSLLATASDAPEFVDASDLRARGIEPSVGVAMSRHDIVRASDVGIAALEPSVHRGGDESAIDVDAMAVTSYRASDRRSPTVSSSEPLRPVKTESDGTNRDPQRTDGSRFGPGDGRRDDRMRTTHDRAIDDGPITINVSIGRIDVVRPTAPSIPTPVARPSLPRPSLDDYMRLRAKVRGG